MGGWGAWPGSNLSSNTQVLHKQETHTPESFISHTDSARVCVCALYNTHTQNVFFSSSSLCYSYISSIISSCSSYSSSYSSAFSFLLHFPLPQVM